MPCMHPFDAWRLPTKKTSAGHLLPGAVTLNRLHADGQTLKIPCGTCIGCNKSKAQGWALRCLLELKEHESATFTTLTYAPEHEPFTLDKRDLQLFNKRIRRKSIKPIRFFASGEYGEENGRPHYHTILYGMESERDRVRIENAWGKGHVYTVPVTASAIGYTAGYCAKKYNAARSSGKKEFIHYDTGEYWEWQNEFIIMSRKPGIGGKAREKYRQSWRDFGVLNGTRIPVPKYLHKAWEEITEEGEKEEHAHEKYLRSLTKERMTEQKLSAAELIAVAQQKLQATKRKL